MKLLIFSLFPALSLSKLIHITIRENYTQTCPNVKSDIIDRSSLKFSVDIVSEEGRESSDQIILTDINGETRSVSFPGCYRVKLSFRMTKPIHNPYIEAFLQLGQNIPCKSEGHDTLVNICTNITQGNWCPQSSNGHLRALLENKQTCQFCHICDSISEESKEANTLRKYIFNEGMERCDTEQDQQTLYFKICTPSRHEINEQQGENREKLEEYWSYLKQGVMTTVVHVMDRVELSESKRAQCQQMCGTYENKRGVSHSYRNTLLKSIETMCRPVDNYAACMYHTVKFDMDGDFY